jgi:hypothetical protein
MSKRRISCGMPMGTFGANLYAPFYRQDLTPVAAAQ